MRVVLLIIACVFLAGCPPFIKVYFHNDSDDTVRVESLSAKRQMTTIRAGDAEAIQAGSEADVCFELSVGSDARIYGIDPNAGPYITSTAYGGRLDIHFEGDAMYVRSNTGERLEVLSRAKCNE